MAVGKDLKERILGDGVAWKGLSVCSWRVPFLESEMGSETEEEILKGEWGETRERPCFSESGLENRWSL